MIERIHNVGEADPDAGCGNPELSQNQISGIGTSGQSNNTFNTYQQKCLTSNCIGVKALIWDWGV